MIFFGPSQKRILEYGGEMKKMLEDLRRRGAIDAACIGVAKELGIERPLEDLGLDLVPVGNRIKYFLEKNIKSYLSSLASRPTPALFSSS